MEEQVQNSTPVSFERKGGDWYYHDDEQSK